MAKDQILKGELHSNRSIIFDVIKEYESCYADCKAAISYKYGADKPDRLKMLCDRMNRAEAKSKSEEKENKNDFYLHPSLELMNSPKNGLHVKAKKNIQKNEILFVEENQGFAPIIEDEFQDWFTSFSLYIQIEPKGPNKIDWNWPDFDVRRLFILVVYKLGTLPKVILFLLFEGTTK